jgi:hypothetical protein
VNFNSWVPVGEQIYYFPVSTLANPKNELRRVNSDSTNDTLVRAQARLLSFERSAVKTWGDPGQLRVGKAVYFCDLNFVTNNCMGTAVVGMDLATGKMTTFGSFPNLAGYASISASGSTTSNEGVLTFSLRGTKSNGFPQRDLYFAKSGVPNSLVRLTNEMQ